MVYEKMNLFEDRGASLIRYQLDKSSEMPNVAVRPAVVIIPGGGYAYCSDREAEPVAIAFLNMGFHTFVLHYSVGMHGLWPRPFEEGEKALSIIRENAHAWNIDTNKIAVVGFSAGGHLAASLGTMGRIRPNAMILGYPAMNPSIMQTGYLQERMNINGREIIPYPHIAEYVDEKTSPAFVFLSGEDSIIRFSDMAEMLGKMEACGIPFELHHFAYGGHGFSLSTDFTSSGAAQLYDPDYRGKWISLCLEWLKRTWGEFAHTNEINESGMRVIGTYQGEEYSLDDRIENLLENEECVSILSEVFPDIKEFPELDRSESLMYAIRFLRYGEIEDFRVLQKLEERLNKVQKPIRRDGGKDEETV